MPTARVHVLHVAAAPPRQVEGLTQLLERRASRLLPPASPDAAGTQGLPSSLPAPPADTEALPQGQPGPGGAAALEGLLSPAAYVALVALAHTQHEEEHAPADLGDGGQAGSAAREPLAGGAPQPEAAGPGGGEADAPAAAYQDDPEAPALEDAAAEAALSEGRDAMRSARAQLRQAQQQHAERLEHWLVWDSRAGERPAHDAGSAGPDARPAPAPGALGMLTAALHGSADAGGGGPAAAAAPESYATARTALVRARQRQADLRREETELRARVSEGAARVAEARSMYERMNTMVESRQLSSAEALARLGAGAAAVGAAQSGPRVEPAAPAAADPGAAQELRRRRAEGIVRAAAARAAHAPARQRQSQASPGSGLVAFQGRGAIPRTRGVGRAGAPPADQAVTPPADAAAASAAAAEPASARSRRLARRQARDAGASTDAAVSETAGPFAADNTVFTLDWTGAPVLPLAAWQAWPSRAARGRPAAERESQGQEGDRAAGDRAAAAVASSSPGVIDLTLVCTARGEGEPARLNVAAVFAEQPRRVCHGQPWCWYLQWRLAPVRC